MVCVSGDALGISNLCAMPHQFSPFAYSAAASVRALGHPQSRSAPAGSAGAPRSIRATHHFARLCRALKMAGAERAEWGRWGEMGEFPAPIKFQRTHILTSLGEKHPFSKFSGRDPPHSSPSGRISSLPRSFFCADAIAVTSFGVVVAL